MNTAVKKDHWSKRAKQGYGKIAQFFADYGSKTSLSGGTLLVMGGAATMMAGAASGSPELAQVAGTSSAALVIAGALKIGGTSVSELIAKGHLKHTGNVFDGDKANAASAPRGATAVEDPVLSDPAFQRAMGEAFRQLQNDPNARREFTDMIQNSPVARMALLNAQKQIDKANEMKADATSQAPEAGHHQDESEQSSPSMTYH